MKLLLFFISFFIVSPVYATLGAATVFAIDSAGTTTGACFYDSGVASPGTDRSQAAAAAFSGTDLASTNGTTNPCVITSATHNFDSADNGNAVIITAGTNFTVQRALIVSTAANAATLDRACGSAATLSGGTWKLGGACSLGNATAGITDATLFAMAVAGNVFWIKSGSYTVANAALVGAAGAGANPIFYKGFTSTRGDVTTGTNRPSLNMNNQVFTMAVNNEMYNLIWTGGGTSVVSLNGTGHKVINSKITNTSTSTLRAALSCVSGSGAGLVMNSELISYRGYGVNGNTTSHANSYIGNYFHDSITGIFDGGTTTTFFALNNIFGSMATNGIHFSGARSGASVIAGNTFFGGITNKTGTAINIGTGSTNISVMNNIIYGFVTGIAHADTTQKVGFDDYNDYFNNTADVSGWIKGANDQALNPLFVNVGQVVGTNGSTSGSVLTDATVSFANVVDNQDFLLILSGGPTTGQYKITGHTATTVTVDISLGTTASGVNYQVTTGRNFAIGTNLKGLGWPGAYPASLSTGYLDMGAVQRREPKPGRTK